MEPQLQYMGPLTTPPYNPPGLYLVGGVTFRFTTPPGCRVGGLYLGETSWHSSRGCTFFIYFLFLIGCACLVVARVLVIFTNDFTNRVSFIASFTMPRLLGRCTSLRGQTSHRAVTSQLQITDWYNRGLRGLYQKGLFWPGLLDSQGDNPYNPGGCIQPQRLTQLQPQGVVPGQNNLSVVQPLPGCQTPHLLWAIKECISIRSISKYFEKY